MFSIKHLSEPLLEFGGGGRHVDVRYGLMDFGPADFTTDKTKTLRLGVVGSAQSAGKLRDWLRKCEDGIPAKNSRQPTLFPAFPGSSMPGPFRCYFEVDDQDVRTVSATAISKITAEQDDEIAIGAAVVAFAAEVQSLAERDRPPQVIICALPVELIERVSNMRATNDDEEDDEEQEEETTRRVERANANFRGALKAITLSYRVPIQLIWPTTYDNDAVVRRKLATYSTRRVQD
ncbi:hypothetical protein EN933_34435, partial [Mesorhizobium sp. M7A.F.Ca.US.001.01.1.1]